jgi:hypothetical protein
MMLVLASRKACLRVDNLFSSEISIVVHDGKSFCEECVSLRTNLLLTRSATLSFTCAVYTACRRVFGATALEHMWASGSTVVHRSQGHWMRLSLCRIPEHRFGPIRIGKREVDRTMHEHGVEPIDRDPAIGSIIPSLSTLLHKFATVNPSFVLHLVHNNALPLSNRSPPLPRRLRHRPLLRSCRSQHPSPSSNRRSLSCCPWS